MKPDRMLWISAALAMALVQSACSGAPSTATNAPPAGEVAEPTSPPAQTQPTEPPSGGSDVSGIVACQVVTAQEVADLVGGTIFRELEQQASPNCTYEIDPPGPETYATFMVYVEPTDMVQPLVDTMPGDLGDPVPGMGDAAYLQHDEATQEYHLTVLVRGRFGLEVIGDQEDWVVALGRLFLSRLLGP